MISALSEILFFDYGYCRTDEELSCLTPVDTYTPQTAQPNYKGEQQTCSQEPEPEVDHNFDGTFESLPPSFTALLTSCSSEAEQEKQQVAEEVDLKSQITKYMSDTCFSEMLNKVEKVIFQMGGELAL
ncbi:PREDICTED: protein POOR HOMOLOGOUS SYNAPSIS 1 [Nelumbo nucifera]|uniref:Protein POOR HOMOLOGOUS SYNAPSIS 1 n=1 Tax=Nelumbo nucifera TaxID=4432 RepID=A0A1U8Q3H8_NELNU|nr:PREDICTED: protein POOR HOMOLOGOUS SYNAPSIS 1 [Nelumbo nucifera]